ncbi:MAG: MBL fold metallo-hydrolase [Syntrophothermus sp.]
MEMIFIGTGSGRASLKRWFTSTLFQHQDFTLMIDAGDGVSRALLSAGIPYNEIDAIIFTHFHPDHLNGISSLLIQMKMQERKKDLTLIVHENSLLSFNSFLRINNISKEKMEFKLRIFSFRTDSFFKLNGSFGFVPRLNSHISASSAGISEKPVSSSFMLFLDKLKVFYTGDISSREDLYLFKDEKFDIMVSEATHVDFDLLLEAFNTLSPAKLVLTHIDELTEKNLYEWKSSLPDNLKDKIIIASDGLEMKLF